MFDLFSSSKGICLNLFQKISFQAQGVCWCATIGLLRLPTTVVVFFFFNIYFQYLIAMDTHLQRECIWKIFHVCAGRKKACMMKIKWSLCTVYSRLSQESHFLWIQRKMSLHPFSQLWKNDCRDVRITKEQSVLHLHTVDCTTSFV